MERSQIVKVAGGAVACSEGLGLVHACGEFYQQSEKGLSCLEKLTLLLAFYMH